MAPIQERPDTQVTDYKAAAAHFATEDFDQCIAMARQNLQDPTLSHYFRAKNLLLIASAEDDWYAGERCRRHVEWLMWVMRRSVDENNIGGTARAPLHGPQDDTSDHAGAQLDSDPRDMREVARAQLERLQRHLNDLTADLLEDAPEEIHDCEFVGDGDRCFCEDEEEGVDIDDEGEDEGEEGGDILDASGGSDATKNILTSDTTVLSSETGTEGTVREPVLEVSTRKLRGQLTTSEVIVLPIRAKTGHEDEDMAASGDLGDKV